MAFENIEMYVPISHKDRGKKQAHQEFISLLIGTGSWKRGDLAKMKDKDGNEVEFVILNGAVEV